MTEPKRSAALDTSAVKIRKGSSYPAPWNGSCGAREKQALGDAVGLSAFGVNLVRLPPGAQSSQRHWHSHEDEFVYLLEGEVTLVTDAGERPLTAGMIAGFPAGSGDGHHLVNNSDSWAVYLEVGNRSDDDEVVYPDIDLFLTSAKSGKRGFTRRNGEPY